MRTDEAHELSSAIRVVLGPSNGEFLRREKAFLRFVSYLRWPFDHEIRNGAYHVLLAKYMVERVRSQSFVPTKLLDEIDLCSLIEFVTSDALYDLSFAVYSAEEDAECPLVAATVRFIISWQPDSDDRRDAASVKKAHFVIENRYYGRALAVSWRRFAQVWAQFKSVSYFHFVNEYHFGRKMLLDPSQSDFADRVDTILSDLTALRRFFAQSTYVLGCLRDTLYPQTWKAISLPTFPPELVPAKVSLTAPDEKLRELVWRYKS